MQIFKCFFIESEKRFSVEASDVFYIREDKRGVIMRTGNDIADISSYGCMSSRNVGGVVVLTVFSYDDVERFFRKIKGKII